MLLTLRYFYIGALCTTLYLWFDVSTGAEELHSRIGTGLLLTQSTSDPTYVKPVDEIDDDAQFFYDVFKEDFITDINQLKQYDNRILPQPYLDSWYPEALGGTNMNGALNQYDRYFSGGQTLAASWEDTYHHSSLDWYGHCNGYSASVTRHLEAKNSVTRPKGCQPTQDSSCVTYTPLDIKAMLAEIYMNASSRFLGGRRCEISGDNGGLDNINPHTRLDPTIKDACEDIDPGVMHVSLLNWMGKKGQYAIADLQRDAQVWNYPIYGYSVTYGNGGQKLTAAQAAALVWGGPLATYTFNPSAVSFLQVNMVVYIAHVTTHPQDGTYQTREYQYVLELDAQDRVMGGEWIGDSITTHPDFLWVAFPPVDQTGDAPGSRTLGNYYVKAKDVIELWADSLKFDPQDPFNDPKNTLKALEYPVVDLNWGKFPPYFDATLNGKSVGAAFMGEKAQLVVTRESDLSGDAKLVLSLNGSALGTYDLTGDDKVNVALDVQPGLNFLDFVWTREGREVKTANQTLAIYAM